MPMLSSEEVMSRIVKLEKRNEKRFYPFPEDTPQEMVDLFWALGQRIDDHAKRLGDIEVQDIGQNRVNDDLRERLDELVATVGYVRANVLDETEYLFMDETRNIYGVLDAIEKAMRTQEGINGELASSQWQDPITLLQQAHDETKARIAELDEKGDQLDERAASIEADLDAVRGTGKARREGVAIKWRCFCPKYEVWLWEQSRCPWCNTHRPRLVSE